MQRPLAGLERVGTAGLEREQRTAVVQHEAGLRRDEARSEALIVALDQRHDVAVAIDHAQVDRVLPSRLRDRGEVATASPGRPRAVVDERGPPHRALLVEHLRDRHVREARIADVAQQIGIGQLLRFDHHVHRARAVEPVVGQWKPFHQVEHHQRGDALALRRNLRHRPSAVGGLDRARPIRARTPIDRRPSSCRRAPSRIGDDRLGDGPAVEAVPPALGDQAQGVRARSGLRKISPARGGLPLMRNVWRASGWDASSFSDRAPGAGDDLGDREPVLGVVDGRRQQRLEVEPSRPSLAAPPSRPRRPGP